MAKKPTILIPANIIDYTGIPAQAIRNNYINAAVEIMDCTPLILPVISDFFDDDYDDILDIADGILLTGAPSHLAPHLYGAEQVFDDADLDPARDATNLPLIRKVLERDKPMMVICRGFQELNIVLGGTLHQKIHEIDGKLDHRLKADTPFAEAYSYQSHNIHIEKGGLMEKMGLPETFMVTSVHQQAIDKLGAGLKVEARAPDGVIEAFSLPGKRFIFGVQFHPEADFDINPQSATMLKAFADVLRGQHG